MISTADRPLSGASSTTVSFSFAIICIPVSKKDTLQLIQRA
jgi:hypothetical protein